MPTTDVLSASAPKAMGVALSSGSRNWACRRWPDRNAHVHSHGRRRHCRKREAGIAQRAILERRMEKIPGAAEAGRRSRGACGRRLRRRSAACAPPPRAEAKSAADRILLMFLVAAQIGKKLPHEMIACSCCAIQRRFRLSVPCCGLATRQADELPCGMDADYGDERCGSLLSGDRRKSRPRSLGVEQEARKSWPVFRSLQGGAASWRPDIVAGLTLARSPRRNRCDCAARRICAPHRLLCLRRRIARFALFGADAIFPRRGLNRRADFAAALAAAAPGEA